MIDLHLAAFPDVPDDIARLILETAAWEDDITAYILVFVSKLVRRWIDPILYHSVALCTSQQLAAFHDSMILRSDTSFLSRTVKILCIGDLSSGSLESELHSFADIWLWTRAVLEVCTGVERLAIWLANHELDLAWLARYSRLRPTHMSFDVSDHDWDARPYCVEMFPESLTHLNLDCFNDHDIEDIPWQKIFARCPNLAHISLSGDAPHRSCYKGTLFSLIVSPLLPQLPATLVVFALVVTFYPSQEMATLKNEIVTISEASDRFVVVCLDSPPAQIRGLHVFEKKHGFASEWGSWRGEDTWDLAQKYVAARNRKHDKRNTESK